MGRRKTPPVEPERDWAFEIGQRAEHYGSAKLGTVRGRQMQLDPMYNDDGEYYLLEFDDGSKGFYFDRQLSVTRQ